MIKFFLLASICFFSTISHAIPKITVHGVLMSYDQKVAKIRSSPSTVVTVPLKSLRTPVKGLLVGTATVQAQVTFNEMASLNGKLPVTKKKTASKF